MTRPPALGVRTDVSRSWGIASLMRVAKRYSKKEKTSEQHRPLVMGKRLTQAQPDCLSARITNAELIHHLSFNIHHLILPPLTTIDNFGGASQKNFFILTPLDFEPPAGHLNINASISLIVNARRDCRGTRAGAR